MSALLPSEKGCALEGRAMLAAMHAGDMSLIQWVHDNMPSGEWQRFEINDSNDAYPGDTCRRWKEFACGDAAIESGDIDLFKWVCTHDKRSASWMRGRALSAAASV